MTGRLDIPLTRKGEEQARLWGERLRAVPFDAAWCSPLLRAKRTAELILEANTGALCKATTLPGLMEVSLGAWEGKSKAEVIRHYPELWEKRGRDIVNTAPPGGESFAEVSARVLPVFKALCIEAVKYDNCLTVAHQAVNRAIIAHATGQPPDTMLEIAQPHCSLTLFALEPDSAARILKQETM